MDGLGEELHWFESLSRSLYPKKSKLTLIHKGFWFSNRRSFAIVLMVFQYNARLLSGVNVCAISEH